MDDILDKIERPLFFTDKEIFTKIWLNPRQIFKYINDNHYEKYMTIVLVFAGITRAFDRAISKDLGDDLSLLAILGICVFAGGLFGWISYYIYAALISWTGKWLDGEGDTASILRVIAYAMIPSILGLLFLIPQISIFGIELFKSDGAFSSGDLVSDYIVYGSMILQFILALWTVVFSVTGISEVQKFGVGKAILNILLPFLVIFVPLILLIGFFGGF